MSAPPPGVVGVGVGVYFVRGATGRRELLLGLRRGSHQGGTWAAAGGRVEFGQSPIQCAIEETLQETGMVVLPRDLQLLAPTSDRFAPDRHDITINYEVEWSSQMGEPRVLEPDKCEEWRWLTFAEARELPLMLCVRNLLALGWCGIS